MTADKRRQTIVLAALAVVLVVFAVLQLRGERSAPAATRPRSSNPPSRGSAGAAGVPVSGVHLDLLKQAGNSYPEPDRNPFQFRARPAPPPPPGAGRGRAAAGRGTGAPPPPPVPSGPPPLPPIPWRLIGVASVPGGPGFMGAFSDGRGNTTWAKEGDIIDGRYRVLRVGSDSADLAYTDGRGRQSLRLPGQ